MNVQRLPVRRFDIHSPEFETRGSGTIASPVVILEYLDLQLIDNEIEQLKEQIAALKKLRKAAEAINGKPDSPVSENTQAQAEMKPADENEHEEVSIQPIPEEVARAGSLKEIVMKCLHHNGAMTIPQLVKKTNLTKTQVAGVLSGYRHYFKKLDGNRYELVNFMG